MPACDANHSELCNVHSQQTTAAASISGHAQLPLQATVVPSVFTFAFIREFARKIRLMGSASANAFRHVMCRSASERSSDEFLSVANFLFLIARQHAYINRVSK